MQEQYCPHEIESFVQKYWEENKTFQVSEREDKEKYYCLSMLPYPSGHLHMGHVRNYTIGDTLARYQRMLGKNVLQPIGWDAFGLPAERAAIENDVKPSSWTRSNINYMKTQIQALGFSYDWSREITTCQPEYYHWEQWFFTQLYEKGLVYKKTAEVNWCPHDMTVLANEQVMDGSCWRCQSKVEFREIPQWFIKITSYAEELLNDLNQLSEWPEKVKTMQRNWIGRSEGTEIKFPIVGKKEALFIYTTRLDTLMGVTYLAVAMNHPLVNQISLNNPALRVFISTCRKTKVSESNLVKLEKKGMNTDLFAEHPLTGEKLPIWVANYVLMEYGTGAIMATPAHNQADWDFAMKYHVAIKAVILNADGQIPDLKKSAMTEKGILFNSDQFNGLSFDNATKEIQDQLIKKNYGQKIVKYRLRDWSVSRQRYWGTPIPMLTLKDGAIVPVPEYQLPVILPEDLIMNGIASPIKTNVKWAQTSLNGQLALRETDTFDTFIQSSWYYARYTCPNYSKGMLDSKSTNYWLPVDQYVGGIEHAIMHLLYFRFFHKLLRDAGFVSTDEPAKRLLCQGMVLADAFYRIGDNGEHCWIAPNNVVVERDTQGQIIQAFDKNGEKLVYAGMTKMSKSKKNGINVQLMIDRYGSDTIRLFIMFAAPADMPLEWRNSGAEGAHRFLKRIWKLTRKHVNQGLTMILNVNALSNQQKTLRCALHKTIRKVSDDIGRRQTFNTAISAIMKLFNKLENAPQEMDQDRALMQEALLAIIRMLNPFTPHICFILWRKLGGYGNIDFAPWPQVELEAIQENHLTIAIQVNNKIRGTIVVALESTQSQIEALAIKEPCIEKYLRFSRIRKIIYVPGQLINLILN
ncbi:leucine--tRNA ligase [Candidatus Erwinia haradaeae]|uniref:Leucine--tRNA ligase n=1 Tax=Candidatus Erwinia haradaeae TaxID=1922217 RepID=A0A451D823_9GAMM|nr:leucine--tRNA ligase [Candidatus Erwinia haradaeae]VFP81967.1 Leucine--tRNA ligase [Candidatus Erwinia haradaeae]